MCDMAFGERSWKRWRGGPRARTTATGDAGGSVLVCGAMCPRRRLVRPSNRTSPVCAGRWQTSTRPTWCRRRHRATASTSPTSGWTCAASSARQPVDAPRPPAGPRTGTSCCGRHSRTSGRMPLTACSSGCCARFGARAGAAGCRRRRRRRRRRRDACTARRPLRATPCSRTRLGPGRFVRSTLGRGRRPRRHRR